MMFSKVLLYKKVNFEHYNEARVLARQKAEAVVV
jgi:hypothetical protein